MVVFNVQNSFWKFEKKFTIRILQKVGFSDFNVVDKNSYYVTIVTFHNSKVSKIKWEGNVQLFDGHNATIKAVIIQIKLDRFSWQKFSETISSHLKWKFKDYSRTEGTVIVNLEFDAQWFKIYFKGLFHFLRLKIPENNLFASKRSLNVKLFLQIFKF